MYWWRAPDFPYAVTGDASARDYTISCDVLFTQHASSAGVIACFSKRQRHANSFRGYLFTLSDTGRWQLLKNSVSAHVRMLRSGVLAKPAGVRRWHAIALTVKGSKLTASIDGRRFASVVDRRSAYSSGIAGIEAGAVPGHGTWSGTSWPVVQYRRLRITP